MPRILLIGLQNRVAELLQREASGSGIELDFSDSLITAEKKLHQEHYDLLCLDSDNTPGEELSLLQRLRERGLETPTILMSSRTDENYVIKAFLAGVEDFLKKPIGLKELRTRLEKAVRKFAPPLSEIHLGDITIDPQGRTIAGEGMKIPLGQKELDILLLLISRRGDIVSRESIIQALYEDGDLYDRTIDSHISHLRRKLAALKKNEFKINSVYGRGYRLIASLPVHK
jgi:DNA-binding response OmpR family regulator